jgi:hypothetical protein
MHTRSDQAMKQLLRAALESGGSFTSELEVSPDPQNADGYFVPNPNRQSPVASTLLGRMTRQPCSFEVFSATPDASEIGECIRKHLNLRHILLAKHGPAGLPRQWIISSGKPSSAFRSVRYTSIRWVASRDLRLAFNICDVGHRGKRVAREPVDLALAPDGTRTNT